MMAEKKRQCGTCRFFVETGKGGHGKCTHPKRAGADAELLLLRPTELACRTQWGDSLWQDQNDDSDPNEQKTPQQPSLPEPIAAQLQFDDEVTSVSIAGSKSTRSSFDDDVVDSGAVATGMASWNDPIQQERLNLLRKSDQDALAGARKRHMEKQARQRELIPFADDDTEPTNAASSKDDENPPVEDTSADSRSRTFAPDDFVEEERVSEKDDDARFDDEMVDEGVGRAPNRSPRMRKLLREPNDPKSSKAMKFSMPSEMRVTSNNPDHREQWNSVPTLNPGFELPLSKPAQTEPSAQLKISASAAPMASSAPQYRPVSHARELVSEDRLRNERAQRQLLAPLAQETPVQGEGTRSQTVTERPRLTEAPSRDSAPLDQIRSSPLRGYQPAARKLQQPTDRQRNRTDSLRAGSETRREPMPVAAPKARHQYDAAPSSVRDEALSRPAQATPREVARQRQERPENVQPLHLHRTMPDTPFVRSEIEISPDIPRCCATCTSFRRDGEDGRGTCMNEFAGPRQPMVHARDLACQHTFGSFWIPTDRLVWLKKDKDFSAPTPRVDAMLERLERKSRPVVPVLPDLDELTS